MIENHTAIAVQWCCGNCR